MQCHLKESVHTRNTKEMTFWKAPGSLPQSLSAITQMNAKHWWLRLRIWKQKIEINNMGEQYEMIHQGRLDIFCLFVCLLASLRCGKLFLWHIMCVTTCQNVTVWLPPALFLRLKHLIPMEVMIDLMKNIHWNSGTMTLVILSWRRGKND